MSRILAAVAASVALGCSISNSFSADPSSIQQRLIAFRDRVEAIDSGKETVELADSDRERTSDRLTPKDRMQAKALEQFSKTVTEKDLDAVASFGDSKDGASVRWPFVKLLVDRGRFDAAAKLATVDLLAKPGNREYGLWKWWEWNFSDRKDYNELTRSYTDALLREFNAGNADTKLVVAEVFGKGKAESQLPLEKFKGAIKYDRQEGAQAESR